MFTMIADGRPLDDTPICIPDGFCNPQSPSGTKKVRIQCWSVTIVRMSQGLRRVWGAERTVLLNTVTNDKTKMRTWSDSKIVLLSPSFRGTKSPCAQRS